MPVSWKGQLAIRLPLLIGLAQPAGMIAELGDTHRAGAATLGFGIATSWCVSAMILPAALELICFGCGETRAVHREPTWNGLPSEARER